MVAVVVRLRGGGGFLVLGYSSCMYSWSFQRNDQISFCSLLCALYIHLLLPAKAPNHGS